MSDTIGYHEPIGELSKDCRETHQALASLIEELEAVDWYNQRADVCADAELKAILVHNRNEEIEHAAMTLEWLRRRIPEFDAELKEYLFTSGSIAAHEAGGDGEGSEGDGRAASGDLGIGKPGRRTMQS